MIPFAKVNFSPRLMSYMTVLFTKKLIIICLLPDVFKRSEVECEMLRSENVTTHQWLVRLFSGIWNSLPDEVVTAGSTNVFKNRLDRFLSHQDFVYNHKAELTGTGSRSSKYI